MYGQAPPPLCAYSDRVQKAGQLVAAPTGGDGIAGRRGRRPLQVHHGGSCFQGRRLPPLRGSMYRDDNLKSSATTGRIKGGAKAPPLPIQGWGPGEGKDGIPSPGVLSLFVHFLFARAKRKWTLTRQVRTIRSGGWQSPPRWARGVAAGGGRPLPYRELRGRNISGNLTFPACGAIITDEKGELGIPG